MLVPDFIWESQDLHRVLAKNLIKIKERIRKFEETGDLRCIYHNKLNKTRFQCDMDYGAYKQS